ncbi:hypothetical protein BpHYR1_053087, partial [Brachionus plicatilis]
SHKKKLFFDFLNFNLKLETLNEYKGRKLGIIKKHLFAKVFSELIRSLPRLSDLELIQMLFNENIKRFELKNH